MPQPHWITWVYLAHRAPSAAYRAWLEAGFSAERPPAVASAVWDGARRAAERCRWADREDLRVLRLGTPGYPTDLTRLDRPPLFLFLRGPGSLPDQRDAVAIVGTRDAGDDGLRSARLLAGACSDAGITVVSGLAMGIDAAAHSAALSGAGGTVAVTASGVLRPGPARNLDLAERIIREGLLISEAPPDAEAGERWRFPLRNRIIAALARVTLVVEAGRPSGALSTARHARELGRVVAAVPGSVHVRNTEGSNALIRDGARVVTEPRDLFSLLEHPGPAPQGPPGKKQPPARTAAQLAELWGVDETAARRTLLTLELQGGALRLAGDRYRVFSASQSNPKEMQWPEPETTVTRTS